MQVDMTIIEGAYTLYAYGIPEGEETLKEMGITGNIKQKVSQKRTKYRLYMAKMNAAQKQTAKNDYYKLLARVGKNFGGSQLNPDMLLTEWIGILSVIKEENEFKNRQARSNNRRGV